MTTPAVERQERSTSRVLPRRRAQGHRSHLAAYGVLPSIAAGDEGLLVEIEASGLTGRGGAAFPTAVKLASVATSRRTSVIANGTEGEPASAKDRVLLARNPHLVLDGLDVAARLLGAQGATIAVGRGADEAARALETAIDERPRSSRPRLVRVPDRFVAGEESALVTAVGGGRARPTGRRPFEDGSLVQNVETLAHLALVARYGAEWFRAAGTRAEPGTALATVGGAVANPGVLEFEIGTTLGRLLERCGGITEPIDAVLVGGYFGTWLPAEHDLVLSNEALGVHGAALGARVIIAFPRSACGLVELARIGRYMAGESAGQCGPCIFGLPALAHQLDALAGSRVTAGLQRIKQLETQMARRGACAHPDGTLGFVTSGLTVFREELDRHHRGTCSATSHQRVLPTGRSRGWR